MACKIRCCRCCRYPNGMIQGILVQFLLFCGWVLSLDALVNCKFVETSVNLDDDSILGNHNSRFGFYAFELPDEKCSYDLFSNNAALRDAYRDLLGNDWNAPRVLASIATAVGFIAWIFSFFFICFSFKRAVRYLLAFTVFCATLFQGLSFLVFQSSFCRSFNCSITKGAYVAIGATLSYFLSCILVCCMKDYDPITLTKSYAKEEAMDEEAQRKGQGDEKEEQPKAEENVDHKEQEQAKEEKPVADV